jgi:hypothetical protein
LERAQEHRKSLDLVGIKKKLDDYEQMLKYCTLMKRKNKMKDSKAKSKKWWVGCKGIFYKGVEKESNST